MEVIRLVLGTCLTNTYVVREGEFCAVIDPEANDGELQSAILEHGWKPTCILITHAHFDHVQGIPTLPQGLPVYAHALEAAYIPKRNTGIWPYEKNVEITNDIVQLTCGERIGPFSAVHVPGHSPGSLLFASSGIVFSGDMLFVGGMPNLSFPQSDTEDYMRSVANMTQELPMEAMLCPGHGAMGKVADGFAI